MPRYSRGRDDDFRVGFYLGPPFGRRPNRSFVSKQGADDLGMDDADVVAVIQALTLADCEKSMTSIADHKVWQDVYKTIDGGRTLYVKFTLDAQGALFLISFKEA